MPNHYTVCTNGYKNSFISCVNYSRLHSLPNPRECYNKATLYKHHTNIIILLINYNNRCVCNPKDNDYLVELYYYTAIINQSIHVILDSQSIRQSDVNNTTPVILQYSGKIISIKALLKLL